MRIGADAPKRHAVNCPRGGYRNMFGPAFGRACRRPRRRRPRDRRKVKIADASPKCYERAIAPPRKSAFGYCITDARNDTSVAAARSALTSPCLGNRMAEYKNRRQKINRRAALTNPMPLRFRCPVALTETTAPTTIEG